MTDDTAFYCEYCEYYMRSMTTTNETYYCYMGVTDLSNMKAGWHCNMYKTRTDI